MTPEVREDSKENSLRRMARLSPDFSSFLASHLFEFALKTMDSHLNVSKGGVMQSCLNHGFIFLLLLFSTYLLSPVILSSDISETVEKQKLQGEVSFVLVLFFLLPLPLLSWLLSFHFWQWKCDQTLHLPPFPPLLSSIYFFFVLHFALQLLSLRVFFLP